MQKMISPLEYPEVQAHLNRLKAEHKRLSAERPHLGIRRPKPVMPVPPPPKPRHALTLTIPITPETLGALRISTGHNKHLCIDTDALIEMTRTE